MNTLSQHRFLTTSLFLATLVALLARPITVLFVNLLHGSATTSSVSSVHHVRPRIRRKVTPAVTKQAAVVVSDVNNVSLQPMWKHYEYSLIGKATCEGKPCVATLRILIIPDGATEPVITTLQTEGDGTYQLKIPFQALPNQQVDWKVTAVSAELLSGEAHGRYILSEESSVFASQDVDLH